jgi:hypothetical protein
MREFEVKMGWWYTAEIYTSEKVDLKKWRRAGNNDDAVVR